MADDEMLDTFDDALRPAAALERATVHSDGHWHQVFHCLAVRLGDTPTVLLQRRLRTARAFPGLLDLTATGHLAAGEQPRDGVRELEEEVGLVVDPDDLVPLGRRLMIDSTGGEGHNREIVHVFLLPTERALTDFQLADRDVDGLVEVTIDDLLSILADGTAHAPAHELDRTGTTAPVTITAADLVPPVDGYWTVLAVMARRFADGVGPIAI